MTNVTLTYNHGSLSPLVTNPEFDTLDFPLSVILESNAGNFPPTQLCTCPLLVGHIEGALSKRLLCVGRLASRLQSSSRGNDKIASVG